MAKILKAADLEASLSKAAGEEKIKAIAVQVIEVVKAYEVSDAEKQGKIETLTTAAVAKDAVLVEVKAELETANEELAASNELVAELSAKLEKAEENRGNPNLVVTIKKKDYMIIGNKFQTAKGSLTAEQLAKDEELLLDMIAKGSGAIIAQ